MRTPGGCWADCSAVDLHPVLYVPAQLHVHYFLCVCAGRAGAGVLYAGGGADPGGRLHSGPPPEQCLRKRRPGDGSAAGPFPHRPAQRPVPDGSIPDRQLPVRETGQNGGACRPMGEVVAFRRGGPPFFRLYPILQNRPELCKLIKQAALRSIKKERGT